MALTEEKNVVGKRRGVRNTFEPVGDEKGEEAETKEKGSPRGKVAGGRVMRSQVMVRKRDALKACCAHA